MDVLICYDISNTKRLIKCAKELEKLALRVQYSVFLLSKTNQREVDKIVKILENIISSQDDIRIYIIDMKLNISLGTAISLEHPFIVT